VVSIVFIRILDKKNNVILSISPLTLTNRAIVRELFGYIFFILIVYVISYGNRDPKSFMFKNVIENNFIIQPGFDKVGSTEVINCTY